MPESQEFRFVNTTHPDLIDMPSRTVRTSGVEGVLNSDQKKVFFVNKTTREHTHEIILSSDACCGKCTELRRTGEDNHCAPFRVSGDPFVGSYDLAFLNHLDLRNAVCPLYLIGKNPPIVKFALEILDRDDMSLSQAGTVTATLEQFPNATL